jgi:cellulose synthase/poly-beta-1,6-N-acetylglucosamine synthase-like glycosyltransferase
MLSMLAYVALGFLALRTLVVIVNFIHSYALSNAGEDSTGDLSVLIPCRNEEGNIGNLLSALLSLESQPGEIIVCDDHSTDNTYEIVTQLASRVPNLHCFKSAPLPEGYTGKNWACEQLAGQARGASILFTDADMIFRGDILGVLVKKMNKKQLDLVSVFPKQQMHTLGERTTVPVMNWILLSLLPLPLVRLSKMKSLSAANGQCMLYRSSAYQKLQPHRQLKSSPVEDIESMKLCKRKKLRCATYTGDERISCRMYQSRKEAMNGFSRNILHYFSRNIPWLLFFVVFTTFGLLFIALWSFRFFLVSLLVAACCRFLISLASRQNPVHNLLLFPVQHINFLLLLMKAFQQKTRGTIIWKERHITVP